MKSSDYIKFFKIIIIIIGFLFLVIFFLNLYNETVKNQIFSKSAEKFKYKDRSVLWLASSHLYLKKPLYGGGIGNFPIVYRDTFYGEHPFAKNDIQSASNTYLQTLVECGPLGMIAIILILISSINIALKIFAETEERDPSKKFLCAAFISLIAIFLYGFFQHIFFLRILEIIFVLNLGIIFFLTKDKIIEIYFFKTKNQRDVFFFVCLIILFFRFLLP
jgi:O-antigen ligase